MPIERFEASQDCTLLARNAWIFLTSNYAPCMIYLPTKLSDFIRANVGKYSIHGDGMSQFANWKFTEVNVVNRQTREKMRK